MLQQLWMNITHSPGAMNTSADGASRYPAIVVQDDEADMQAVPQYTFSDDVSIAFSQCLMKVCRSIAAGDLDKVALEPVMNDLRRLVSAKWGPEQWDAVCGTSGSMKPQGRAHAVDNVATIDTKTQTPNGTFLEPGEENAVCENIVLPADICAMMTRLAKESKAFIKYAGTTKSAGRWRKAPASAALMTWVRIKDYVTTTIGREPLGARFIKAKAGTVVSAPNGTHHGLLISSEGQCQLINLLKGAAAPIDGMSVIVFFPDDFDPAQDKSQDCRRFMERSYGLATDRIVQSWHTVDGHWSRGGH
jgi:hypothetical protein